MSEHVSGEAIPHLSGYSEAELDQAFAAISREVESSAAALETAEAVEQFRLQWLGRKQGRLKSISDAWLKNAPPDAKKLIRQRFNALKESIEHLTTAGGSQTAAKEISGLDITLPGIPRRAGSEHPLTPTMNEIVSV